VKTFENLNLHTHAKVQLKFVNDVFLNDKKVCGVLSRMETVPGSDNYKLMIGIGVNLNTMECHYSDLKIATSVLIETGIRTSVS
jgi:BirA family biotin operon repressor/biotin-[acetyl-CoA-carboxylase] ligase